MLQNKKMIPAHLIFAFLMLIFARNAYPESTSTTVDIDNSSTITVSAFNLHTFGPAKAKNPFIINSIVDILIRYDLIFLQEIRDKSCQAMKILLEQLNQRGISMGYAYGMVLSPALGRTYYKEQYAYIYRVDKIEMISAFVFDDVQTLGKDAFSRNPFVAHIRPINSSQSFSIVGAHIAPRDVQNELNAMLLVTNFTKETFENENVILFGDFNADCNYLSNADKTNLALIKDTNFLWHIKDGTDTTTGKFTNCAYDRIISTGTTQFQSAIKNASIYNYQEAFDLNDFDAESVSDHFPVEFIFQL